MKKFLIALIITGCLSACTSKPSPAETAKTNKMIDSLVRIRVKRYVQIYMHQYKSEQQGNSNSNTDYRRIAREEAEQAARRASENRRSIDDALLNVQR
jgi:hypothetical protein